MCYYTCLKMVSFDPSLFALGLRLMHSSTGGYRVALAIGLDNLMVRVGYHHLISIHPLLGWLSGHFVNIFLEL